MHKNQTAELQVKCWNSVDTPQNEGILIQSSLFTGDFHNQVAPGSF